MESLNEIHNKKEDNFSNGGTTNKNNNASVNKKNQINSKSNEYLNILLGNKKKIIRDNSSFLGFRKHSNGNMKKDEKSYDNSNFLNDNNINVVSLNNLSHSKLIDKNENIFRNIFKKDKLKDNNFNTTINNINSIYNNNYNIKFRINKDKLKSHNKINKFINNKVQINNFLNKSKSVNYLENSQMFRKNSSKILQRFCFICEAFEEKLYHSKNCSHLFCKDCGKSFYEQQVEKGIYDNKCPKYSCNNSINLKDIKEFLSSESYTKIETCIKINKTKIINNISNENNLYEFNENNSSKRNSTTIEFNNNDKIKKIKILKKNILKTQIPKSFNKNNNLIHFVSKQHMLKISNFTRFKSTVKNEKEIKKVVCSKCGKFSLFSRDDQNFIKCLNCGYAICKYCFKQIESANTFRKLNSICGICYSRIKFYEKKSYFKKILYEILFVIGGYLVVLVGFSKYEAIFFVGRKRKKKIFYIIFILFLIINIFLFALFFPYFPIFISIFE